MEHVKISDLALQSGGFKVAWAKLLELWNDLLWGVIGAETVAVLQVKSIQI